ncbi:hypothetical protein OQA88_7848 [Cercophora sp. LCS_1]
MAGSPALALKLLRGARCVPAVRATSRAPQLLYARAQTITHCKPTVVTQRRHLSTTKPVPFFSNFTPSSNTPPTPREWKPPSEKCLDERPVLIVGAGNLGRRIALVWASNFRPVTIYDTSQLAIDSAIEYITDNLGAYCAARGTHPGHVCGTTDLRVAVTTGRYEGLPAVSEAADAELNSGSMGPWMAIDCIPDNLDLKIAMLSRLEDILPDNCILASNSSCLSTSEMAPKLRHPEKLLNTHYFIPPRNTMVELMSSTKTHEAIFPFLVEQMNRVGLTPMVVPKGIQSQGFIFNRIWGACKRETIAVLAEGVAKPAEVDELFRDFFHAEKGPCERMDEVGLDRVVNVELHALEQRLEPGKVRAVEWLRDNYVKKGNLGEKTGDGLFTEAERDELKDLHKRLRYKHVEETTDA